MNNCSEQLLRACCLWQLLLLCITVAANAIVRVKNFLLMENETLMTLILHVVVGGACCQDLNSAVVAAALQVVSGFVPLWFCGLCIS